MRAKTKVMSLVFCALVLAFGATAQAQIIHNTTQQNNEVVQYGQTELLGEVRFSAAAACGNAGCTSVASTITITYNGATINNLPSLPVYSGGNTLTYSTGMQVYVSGGYATNFGIADRVSISAINTDLGGQIIMTVAGGFTVSSGDQIRINGVRADVSGKSIGGSVTALVSSSPSNANTFDFVNVTVATVNKSMTVTVTGKSNPLCITTIPNPTIRITEGFATAFVEYTTPGAGARARFGATQDTKIKVSLSNLPSGVTLSWPATISGTAVNSAATGATLVLAADSTSSVAIYTFNTTNQTTSDSLQEYFDITPVVSVAATAALGQATAGAQLWPDTGILRYAHPVVPTTSNNFFAVTRCTTYLLFPFVTGGNTPGFTTGIAIANTSSDDAAFVTGGGVAAGSTASAQSGAITLYGWPSSTKDATGSSTTTYSPSTFTGAAVSAVVSTNLAAGDTWTGVIDGTAAFVGFQGYVIAKCDFQFAHGFAFLVGKYNSGSVFDVAHGYLALVIPDPSVTVRATTSGETLNN